MLDLESFVFDKEMDPVQIAIMLAMTRNQEEEKEMLRRYRGMGARCAVTMVSGSNAADRNKTLRSVVGLCLNERIVDKKTEHLHPVAHATWEASQCSRTADIVVGQNFCVKAAVVRKDHWFAICLYGSMGMHELTAHKTVGVGLMTIPE